MTKCWKYPQTQKVYRNTGWDSFVWFNFANYFVENTLPQVHSWDQFSDAINWQTLILNWIKFSNKINLIHLGRPFLSNVHPTTQYFPGWAGRHHRCFWQLSCWLCRNKHSQSSWRSWLSSGDKSQINSNPTILSGPCNCNTRFPYTVELPSH